MADNCVAPDAILERLKSFGTLKMLSKFCICTSKKHVPYRDATSFMESYVDVFRSKSIPPLLWFLTHHSVYTAGTGVSEEDVQAIKARLRSSDSALSCEHQLPFVQTNRGGQITYHGPGQRMVYIVWPLDFFNAITESPTLFLGSWCVDTLALLGVDAFFDRHRIGVWAHGPHGAKKLVALGLRVRKKVVYHGVCINVAPDLRYFKGIKPCGLGSESVASLDEMGFRFTLEELDRALEVVFLKKINKTVTRNEMA